jgi:thymidylate synthase ThyX
LLFVGPLGRYDQVMGFSAKILLDSITPAGARLTTWELRYPRFIHSELMTHRALSRNTASSRAIPASRMRENVLRDPVVPVMFGINQKGMQAFQEVPDRDVAHRWWMSGLEQAVKLHEEGERLGIHKQIVNRVIEPWMYITAIVSATEWGNFYHLRHHKDAQPEFQHLVKIMWPIWRRSKPELLLPDQWHMPLIQHGDWEDTALLVSADDLDARLEILKKVSVGRCARVSYLTHNGQRNLLEDVGLHDRLAKTATDGEPGHWSPFEHVAQALYGHDSRSGNFVGWKQYRKEFPNEHLWKLPDIPYETEDTDVRDVQ